MTPLLRKFMSMNWVLILNMFGLLIFGVFSIYAANHTRDAEVLTTAWNKQIIWIAVGTVVFLVTSLVDYRWVYWGAIPFYVLALFFMVLVLNIGEEVYGTKGWLVIGPIRFQPSQLGVAAGIIMTSLALGHAHNFLPIFRNHFLRLGLAGMICAIPFILVLKGGDFGSAIVWLPVCGAMMLVGNIPFRYLITIGLLGLMIMPWAYFFGLKPHQKERIQVYIDMLSGEKVDTQGAAYAADKIVKAIGSGGFEGKGYLAEKTMNDLGFIPYITAHTDFIFAVLAEEQGFRGAAILLTGFGLLLLQGLFIAFYSRDSVGRLISVGVVALFFAHIFQNVGMNILIMPITGIPLPFISYGGTFVVICMFLCGMMQSVWVHRARPSDQEGHAPLDSTLPFT